jgi:uncharacterized hydantoinase/oxoprolinase family protein
MLDDEAVNAIATHVADRQVRQIASGIGQVMRRLRRSGTAPQVAILAGQGVFLARAAAERQGLTTTEWGAAVGAAAARVAPAAAVAYLLAAEVAVHK